MKSPMGMIDTAGTRLACLKGEVVYIRAFGLARLNDELLNIDVLLLLVGR